MIFFTYLSNINNTEKGNVIKSVLFFANRLIICIFASDKEKMRRGRVVPSFCS